MKGVLLIKYGEISLRKGNRTIFEHHLLDAIRNSLSGFTNIKVTREQGRFLVEDTSGDIDYSAVLPRVRNIFGLTKFCVAAKVESTDIEELKPLALQFFKAHCADAKTFKVNTKRSDKRYPLLSGEISAALGEAIFTAGLDIAVDLHNPSATLWVELRNHTYFYIESIEGAGGLPYGTGGKGIVLLSGGFDSPVAGYLAARRGVEIVGIYFHSPPFVSPRTEDKVVDLARQLATFTGKVKLCIVPFTDVQLFLKEATHPQKLTIMLKRAMLHIASALAAQEGAQCLITGDSVGQVASQTIQSLAAVNSAAAVTILRPLSTMDKQAIINISHEIGTHDISVRPYDDCCTLFVAKHPESKPSTPAIEKIEAKIMPELAPLLEAALQGATFRSITDNVFTLR